MIFNFKRYIFVAHVDLSIKARSLFMDISAVSLELEHFRTSCRLSLNNSCLNFFQYYYKKRKWPFKTQPREKINRPTKHDLLENFTASLSSLAINFVSNGRPFCNGTRFRQNQHFASGCKQKPIPLVREI